MIRRIAAAALILAVAAALLVTVWPQLFGLQRTPVIAHVVALRASASCLAVAVILVLLVAAAVSKRFRRMAASLCVMLLAFVLVNAVVLSSRGFGDVELRNAAAKEITVLSWNTLGPATAPATIAELALDHAADIVVLPETTSAHAIEVAVLMKAAGHPMWVHTRAYDQISPARSTSLLTSVDLGDYHFDNVATTTSVLPTVVATPVDGVGPTIVAVHAVAPTLGQFENWSRDLRLLADYCVGDNVIMAGDFNATLDHMAGLSTGQGAAIGECADAAMVSGDAALGTWPSALPALLGTPIDHIMATPDWTVVGMQVIQSLDENRSDHRPIVARLSRTP